MSNYIIEGIITEITKGRTENSFKIIGTEGYCLRKKKNNEEEKYNVLCTESKIVSEGKKPIHALKISTDFDFKFSESFLFLLTSAMANREKVRIQFDEAEDGEIDIENKKFSISSVSILSD